VFPFQEACALRSMTSLFNVRIPGTRWPHVPRKKEGQELASCVEQHKHRQEQLQFTMQHREPQVQVVLIHSAQKPEEV